MRKYIPGREHIRFVSPYTIATVTLDETDNPRRKEITRAVTSLMPHPPMLTGKVIENNIIGAKTKKLMISISRFNENAHMIYVVM